MTQLKLKNQSLVDLNGNLIKLWKSIKEAKEYFGDKVDFYIDGGKRKSEPSTLIKIENGKIEVLRQGKVFLV